MMNAATESCPNCCSEFVLDRDEDGYTELETKACSDAHCPAKLCPCCPQFKCDGCGQAFCLEHACEEPEDDCRCEHMSGDVADASDCPLHNPSLRTRPLLFCRACLIEFEEANRPEETVRKLEPVIAAVNSPNLPEWGSGAEVA